MSQIMKDIKTMLETATGLKAYPMTIPEGVKLPALSYTTLGSGRDGDSSLNGKNIKRQTISCKLHADNPAECFEYESLLEDLDCTDGGISGVMAVRHQNTVNIFNQSSKKYISGVDFEIKYTTTSVVR